MSDKMMKCAILGYGGAFNMGKAHGTWIDQTGRMKVVAACDLDASRMKEAETDFPGIKTFTDFDEMLANSDAELVVIITPHNTHAKLALKALNAGKHVVLEKPLCITVEEANAMIDAAKKANVTLTAFHNRRHDGDYLAIKDLIDNGSIGEVFHIEAFIGGYGHPGTWWRANKEISGGAMYDWGAHFVDWMLHFVPEKMESVTGFFHKRVWMDVTNEDQTTAIIKFRNGVTAELQVSSIAAAPKPKWRILGTKGAITAEWNNTIKLLTRVGDIPVEGNVPLKQGGGWHEYYITLAKHLLDGEPLEVTAESSRRVIAVLEYAERSAKSGKTEALPVE